MNGRCTKLGKATTAFLKTCMSISPQKNKLHKWRRFRTFATPFGTSKPEKKGGNNPRITAKTPAENVLVFYFLFFSCVHKKKHRIRKVLMEGLNGGNHCSPKNIAARFKCAKDHLDVPTLLKHFSLGR